ncbi:hypothetical protein K504DRAFT_168855 [Pleomassaria siparia CBS 279.74]|uniref:Uncharacterized protein n=1 Tax=Pleomassaria siparia CBS 279.74 TaxID=1314801 RepID=A0A6G1JUV4_9PLEO|nr:hypothetical protein K504DRAFT_168855 [Pleomassaria siparia CBS 279.74]
MPIASSSSATKTMAESSSCKIIKIEDSPEPPTNYSPTDVFTAPSTCSPPTPLIVMDPKDPESFLRRCAGHNKKTKARCSAVIGKNAKNTRLTFLPTCHAHKDQQTFAGWCQSMQKDGERCGRLFRWTPPYLELCDDHQGHPDTPCHFMSLPLELRQEVFRYLLPTQPISSSSYTSPPEALPQPQGPSGRTNPMLAARRAARHNTIAASPSQHHRLFPYPIINMLLVSRRIYEEVKDLLYSSVAFTIDIRRDGTFMCGRRLLEPMRADGSAHFTIDDAEKAAKRFTNTFDFAAVKNYNVDIMVENCIEDVRQAMTPNQHSWDEEVEIYDIRDYVGVVVAGILSKSRNLCRLNVRLGLSKFKWTPEDLLANTKTLVGPFERLRNVRQPKLCGVFDGATAENLMVNFPLIAGPSGFTDPNRARELTRLCLVPKLPTRIVLIGPRDPKFDEYKHRWEKRISEIANTLPEKPPIKRMFSEFKRFYTKLATLVPDVAHRRGKKAFLHRARVARENENVESFRHLRNELIEYWYLYLEQEEQRKKHMNLHMSQMLDSDTYPTHEPESTSPSSERSDSDCMMMEATRVQRKQHDKGHKRLAPVILSS